MDLQLKGKTAIVTGGSAGIGLAVARLLADEGVEVNLLSGIRLARQYFPAKRRCGARRGWHLADDFLNHLPAFFP
jgi:NAD(P)-dependent dehydrogenase (short-subunit alcohol dehydrogenase family)